MSERAEAIKAMASDLKELNAAYEAGAISAREYTGAIKEIAEAQYGLTAGEQAGVAATKTLTSVMTNWNTAFNAAADLAAKNIDELVNLYNAQITAIRTQNLYTQAIALQSIAVGIYGKQSEQATRATVAANYVGALYEQSKKNEVVAANVYATASATNVAKIASAIVDAASSISQFLVAFAIYRTAHTAAQAQIEAETVADTASTAAKQAQTAATIEATTAAETEAVAQTQLAATEVATGAVGGIAGATGAMAILPDIEAVGEFAGLAGLMAIGQHGGFVSETGGYLLHAGETVVPSGAGLPDISPSYKEMGMRASPNIEIHIHATSNVDLARVRMEVEAALAKTLLASQKQRGVYG